MALPPPVACGLPAQFSQWRPHQLDGVEFAVSSRKRFVGINAPTGFGKSAVGLTILRYLGGRGRRGLYVTANKGLQDQIGDLEKGVFRHLVADLRGKSNYPCRLLQENNESGNCDRGPCNDGLQCQYRWGGCSYFDALKRAQDHELPSTNYDKWLSERFVTRPEDGLGKIDTIIFDEAHEAFGKISDAMRIEFRDDPHTQKHIGGPVPKNLKTEDRIQWASILLAKLKPEYDRLNTIVRLAPEKVSAAERRELYHLRTLVGALECAVSIDEDWIEHPLEEAANLAPGIGLTPKWPAEYSEVLFRGIEKIIFMSASITEHDLHKIGVPPDELDFIQFPSSFPPERCQFIWIPTISMKEPLSDEQNMVWMRRCDELLDVWLLELGLKVIIHTVSFRRQRFFLQHSRHVQRCIWNDSKGPRRAQWAVDQFKAAPPGTCLVGPSFGEGWDFPFELCEAQILLKIPFLDTREPLNKARCKDDRDHSPRVAMKKTVQIAGRPMRDDRDRGITVILDDQWSWFLYQKARFAPQYFLQRTTKGSGVPRPPPRLEKRN